MSTDDKDKRRSLSNIIIFKVLPASGLVYLPIRKTSFGKMIGSRIEKTKAVFISE